MTYQGIRKSLFFLCALGLLASSMTAFITGELAQAQEPTPSYLTLNMTGLNASYLVIGQGGVTNSSLILNMIPVAAPNLTGVRMYPISCSFGLLREGDIRSTDPECFVVYNAGNVSVNVTIAVAGDWTGSSDWIHSDDCEPGVDIAGLKAIVQGDEAAAVIVRKTEPYNVLCSNLTAGSRCYFCLEIHAPITFSEHSQKGNSIFIEVTA